MTPRSRDSRSTGIHCAHSSTSAAPTGSIRLFGVNMAMDPSTAATMKSARVGSPVDLGKGKDVERNLNDDGYSSDNTAAVDPSMMMVKSASAGSLIGAGKDDDTERSLNGSYSPDYAAAMDPPTTMMVMKSASVGRIVDPGKDEHAEGSLAEDYSSDNTTSGRRKGTPWTLEEHRRFLRGLKELGKGSWCGIAKRYVQTRNPTQVASHAQKYFQRQENAQSRKRRISVLDVNLDALDNDMPTIPEAPGWPVLPPRIPETPCSSSAPCAATVGDKTTARGPAAETTKFMPFPPTGHPFPAQMLPQIYPAMVPLWHVPPPVYLPSNARVLEEAPNVLRPVPVVPCGTGPSGISELRVEQAIGAGADPSPPPTSAGSSSQQSASRADPAATGSGLKTSSPDPSHAI